MVVLAATLPDWLDADTLRTLLLVALGLIVVIGLWLMRLARRLVLRMIVLAAMLAFAVTVWAQRAELGDCTTECKCRLFGQDVQLSDDRLQQACETRRAQRDGAST